jgi:hypothetical protein
MTARQAKVRARKPAQNGRREPPATCMDAHDSENPAESPADCAAHAAPEPVGDIIDQYVDALVAAAPPLRPEQIARLRVLFSGRSS